MAGSGEHFKALVRSHGTGDDDAFYSVALQVAAQAARQGHHRLAADLKAAVENSRAAQPKKVTSIAQPRGDLSDLVIASHPSVSLKELVLPEWIAGQVQRILSEQRQRKHLLDHGFEPAHRLLFEGPPGTGKTMTAAVLAHELSLPLLTIRLDSLMSKFMGETASKLRVIFEAAEAQRGVYLFDEFDALGGDRAGNDVGEARRILNSFLSVLARAAPARVSSSQQPTTGRSWTRHSSGASIWFWTTPCPMRSRGLRSCAAGSDLVTKGVRWAALAEDMEGLSHADLVRAAESAAKTVILDGGTRVTADDIREALRLRKAASLG